MKVHQPPRLLNLPPQGQVERRLLHHLSALGRPIEPRRLYGPIADDFKLSAARLGEHTRDVLRDVCGYEPARIDALARAGAVSVRE